MAVPSDDVRRAVYVLSRNADGRDRRDRERDRDGASGSPDGASRVLVTGTDAAGVPLEEDRCTIAEWRALVSHGETERPRWVWRTSRTWYPRLLEAGIRVERCVDLALCGAILRGSATTQGSSLNGAPPPWPTETAETPEPDDALFRLDVDPEDEIGATDELVELRSQADAIASVGDAAAASRLRLLLAAESAGSLVAAEMRHAGLPWRADVHDRLLTDALGPRGSQARRPERMEALAEEIRTHLGAPTLNPDSPGDLVRALQRAGINATSTRAWELREVEHPVMPALLEYKKLSRLFTANGWTWLESWVHDGRFRPEYVPGGVVTGRWATNGGGALQLPKQIRAAVVADPGWKLIVADAAQLEPRILAGLAHDERMADAGHGRDLYDGLVASGVVDSRQHAKVGMLAAMYGGTTGDGARVLPRLARAYPRALALVSEAAEAGERGDRVSTLLGRTSPSPSETWFEQQRDASLPDAGAEQERRARSRARDWGRFTRNFVVQGTAAEWALCWMAELRNRLATMQADPPGRAAPPFDRSPHLVYFLHDEVVVHAPKSLAEEAADAVRESARSAGRLLFGGFPVEFPLSVAIVDSYDQAK
ncbi:bifunctional 3'-5' exonuclease/DNA polymerase [Rathayibacter sp. CAU 1779]